MENYMEVGENKVGIEYKIVNKIRYSLGGGYTLGGALKKRHFKGVLT